MISVIVRSKNDAARIRRTLEALLSQKDCGEFEIISCDDSSTDGTAEIIAEYCEIRRLEPDQLPYNPARVLNRAVSFCQGDLIVFNNSDAIPQNEDYLKQLTAPLADPDCGAVYGRQLPRPDAWAFIKREYQRAFKAAGETVIPDFFSLVTSAARREVLVSEPFDMAMQYSEDVEWSRRVRMNMNLKVVYAPDAVVEHSHNYTLREVWKRFFNEGRADFQITGARPSGLLLLRQAIMEIARDLQFEIANCAIKDIPHGIVYRAVQKYAVYRGGCAEARRKRI